MEEAKEIIDWLTVARDWRTASEKANAVRGDRENLIRKFARALDINPSSVRRCTSALDFGEAMQAAGRIKTPAALANVSLEKLTLLQRVARLSVEEAENLLPDVIANKRTVRELRVTETEIRVRLGRTAAAKSDANAMVSLLGGTTFRDEAVAAYKAEARAKGRQVATLTGRGGSSSRPTPLPGSSWAGLSAPHGQYRRQVSGPIPAGTRRSWHSP